MRTVQPPSAAERLRSAELARCSVPGRAGGAVAPAQAALAGVREQLPAAGARPRRARWRRPAAVARGCPA